MRKYKFFGFLYQGPKIEFCWLMGRNEWIYNKFNSYLMYLVKSLVINPSELRLKISVQNCLRKNIVLYY